MKVVTVYQKRGIPLVFLSSDFVGVETTIDTTEWNDKDFDREITFEKRMSLLHKHFWLYVKDREGYVNKYEIHGDIDLLGDLLNNGGTLPLT